MKHPKTDKVIDTAEETAEKAELSAENQPSDLDKSLAIIKALEAEKNQLKDAYLRAAADMENLRKRTATELEKSHKFAITTFAKDLLPVADNLQRALDSVPKDASPECMAAINSLIEGIKLTQQDLTTAFTKNGVHKQESKGKIFNPNMDKVVQEREDKTVPAGTVLEEWQPAYTIGDRILREAVVIVAK